MSSFSKRIKILLIEDDEISQIGITKNIEKSGLFYDISYASCVEEIEFALEDESWDLIISDYNVPGITGIEIIKLVEEKGVEAPVLIVTGQGDENQAANIIKSGAMEYLSKDLITPDRILVSIQSAMRSFENIKEKERALDSLKISELQLKETQKLAKLGSWEYFVESEELLWSDETFRILGLDPETDKPSLFKYFNSTHPDDRAVLSTLMEVSLKDQQKFTAVIRHKKKGQDDYIYVIEKGSVVVEDGKVKKVYGSLIDITELKQTEQKLIEAKLHAERLVKVEQEFLANMSHEIRTPMNAILGFTKILLDEDLKPKQTKKLESIDQAGKNLLVIINDILDFSKIKAGRLRLENQKINLHRTIENSIEQLELIAEKKKIELSYKIDANIPVFVFGDEVRLNQILINLINNAIKFTEEGYVNLNAKAIKLDDSKCELLFEVEDSGVGIEKEKKEMIFESFTQANSDTTRKFGGTGLGLSICKKLVHLHQGEIWVESELGKGSKFFFTIQYQICKGGEEIVEFSNDDLSVDLNGFKLLLVEDNEMNIELASHFLDKWEVNFLVARNGVEAIKYLKKEDFDLVLMDLSMPEMDGYQCTKEIRQGDMKNKGIPIIAMTANAFADDISLCYSVGMNDYISKPFDAKILKNKIYSLIKHKNVYEPEMKEQEESVLNEGNKVSLEILNEMAGGDQEFVHNMMEVFLGEAPIILETIQTTFDSRDYEGLKAIVHKFRSPAGMLGLTEICNLAEFVEENYNSPKKFEEVKIAVNKILILGEESIEQVKKLSL